MRAVALWKSSIVFLSAAKACFLCRGRVDQHWPPFPLLRSELALPRAPGPCLQTLASPRGPAKRPRSPPPLSTFPAGVGGSDRTFGYLGGILQLNTFGSVTTMALDFLDLKGIVHPKKLLEKTLPFFHLWNTKEDIWKNVLQMSYIPMLFGTQCSSNILFCVLQKQVIQEFSFLEIHSFNWTTSQIDVQRKIATYGFRQKIRPKSIPCWSILMVLGYFFSWCVFRYGYSIHI